MTRSVERGSDWSGIRRSAKPHAAMLRWCQAPCCDLVLETQKLEINEKKDKIRQETKIDKGYGPTRFP